jgi:hypothetical protein
VSPLPKSSTLKTATHAVIAFIFLYYVLYNLAFTPLIVLYTVKILPYALRAKGFNIFKVVISLLPLSG